MCQWIVPATLCWHSNIDKKFSDIILFYPPEHLWLFLSNSLETFVQTGGPKCRAGAVVLAKVCSLILFFVDNLRTFHTDFRSILLSVSPSSSSNLKLHSKLGNFCLSILTCCWCLWLTVVFLDWTTHMSVSVQTYAPTQHCFAAVSVTLSRVNMATCAQKTSRQCDVLFLFCFRLWRILIAVWSSYQHPNFFFSLRPEKKQSGCYAGPGFSRKSEQSSSANLSQLREIPGRGPLHQTPRNPTV